MVDDQPELRNLMQLFLRNHDVEVETASDGRDAIDQLTCGSRYDMVFMDMRMPRLDGYEATRWIRGWEKTRNVGPMPIVAVTAHASPEDEVRCRSVGCTDYLAKPVWRDLLVQTLTRYAAGNPNTAASSGFCASAH